jgi:lysophospholipase L1-like esterase
MSLSRTRARHVMPAGASKVLLVVAATTGLVGSAVIGHAGFDRPQRPPAAAPAASPSHAPARPALPPHLVVLGDSVPAGSACDCRGFGAYLGGRLGAALTNDAASGLTSARLMTEAASVQSDLRKATLVTVTIGANDFDEAQASASSCADLSCYDATMKAFTSNMRTILNRLHALTPSGSRVVVTGYWNVFLDGHVGAAQGATYVATSDQLTRVVNSALAAASATHNASYADLYGPFKGAGDVDDTGLLAADGDHPNDAGHRVIATAIERTLSAA